jgi:hypothetical protein
MLRSTIGHVLLDKQQLPTAAFTEARYVLAAVYTDTVETVHDATGHQFRILGLHKQFALINGCAYEATVFTTPGYYLFYAELEAVRSCMNTVARYIGATLCGNYQHLFSANRADSVYEHFSVLAKWHRKNKKIVPYTYTVSSKTREKNYAVSPRPHPAA